MNCPKCETNVEMSTHSEVECRNIQWRSTLCPRLYQGTDTSRLPEAQYAKAMQWEFGPKGLLLSGPTGSGKTRVAYEVLKKFYMAGKKVWVFDCVAFGHQCATNFANDEGEAWIGRMARREIVFFDDLDKPKFTERVETELFGLIEKRIANCLPIIATTQLRGEEFAAKFASEIRGAAIVRRLREFCTAINF